MIRESYIKIILNTLGVKKCQRCGKDGRLCLHHREYREGLTIHDFDVLCNSCHRKEHTKNGITPGGKRVKKEIIKKIADIMNDRESHSIVEIAAELGIGYQSARAYIRMLAKYGKIVQTNRYPALFSRAKKFI